MTRLSRTTLLATIVLAALALTALPAGAGAVTDQQIAEAGVIADTDITTGGWRTSSPDDSDDATYKKLAAKTKSCKDYLKTRKALDTTTDAESDDYQAGFQRLSNHVYVFKTDAAAEKAIGSAKASSVAGCLTEVTRKIFAAQLKADPQVAAQVDDYRIAIEEVPDVLNSVGDESVGYSGGFEITGTDGSVDRLLLTTFLTRVGRSVITYTYQIDADYLSSNPTANQVLDDVINATVARTEAALA